MDNKQDKICTIELEKAFDFDFYKTLFDPTRMAIIVYLANNGPSSVSTIAAQFPQDRTVISRHLDQMYRYNIVDKMKKSREYIYTVNDTFVIEKFEKTAMRLRDFTAEKIQ